MLFRQKDYPNLYAGNHRDTSPPDGKYNCIAWAAGCTNKWWEPVDPIDQEDKYYWPDTTPRNYSIASLIAAYESVGFVRCGTDALEAGVEKLAIYADGDEYMHAARQLDSGKWTSKMGPDEDIEHDAPEDLAGPAFGMIVVYMKRTR